MNELVTIRVSESVSQFLNQKTYSKDFTWTSRKRLINKEKNIQVYFNDLINEEKYVLKIAKKYIEVNIRNFSVTTFFGVINRNNNKIIFDTLSNIIRIKNE